MESLEAEILNEDDDIFGKLDQRFGKNENSPSLKFDESLMDSDFRKSLVVDGRKISLGECTFIFQKIWKVLISKDN